MVSPEVFGLEDTAKYLLIVVRVRLCHRDGAEGEEMSRTLGQGAACVRFAPVSSVACTFHIGRLAGRRVHCGQILGVER